MCCQIRNAGNRCHFVLLITMKAVQQLIGLTLAGPMDRPIRPVSCWTRPRCHLRSEDKGQGHEYATNDQQVDSVMLLHIVSVMGAICLMSCCQF